MFSKNLKNKTKIVSLLMVAVLTLAPAAYALEVEISGNGADSNSQVEVQVETTTTVVQTNEANVANNVETEANTGENQASGNTGGETQITTGDIQEQVSVENELNSSFVEVGCCPADTQVTISGNGAGSENTVELEQSFETNISSSQLAYVVNDIAGSANTGGNSANDNNGSVSIVTGDIHVSGGIQNGPINVSSIAAAAGGGSVSAKITGNGADSKNQIKAEFENETNVFTTYEAYLDNVVYWDLNTGGNEASGNNGAVSIITGDIDFDFFIKNGPINVGGVIVDCCLFDPGEPEGPGEPPEEPGEEVEGPGEPEPGEPEEGEDENGEEVEEEEEVGGADLAEILGLSDTGGLAKINLLLGLFLLAAGLLLLEPVWQKRKRVLLSP